MKVVQINAVCSTGSTGRVVSEIAEFLDKLNIENVLMYSEKIDDVNNAIQIGNKLDHKLHAFLSRLFGMQGYFSRFATQRALKFLDEYKPDIIHLHNLHGNYINLKILFDYISKKNIAVVITLHDCFFFTGKCVHYTIAGCDKWKESCGNCPQLKSGNPSWFFDRTKKMLSDRKSWYNQIEKIGIIGVSDWVTDEAKQSVLKNAAKFTRIYNWVDLKVFRPHESDIRKKLGIENKYMILGVAYFWDTSKGIDDFNKLAEMLDDRFQIVLVGKSVGNINAKIINISRTDDVYELSDLYAAADVFYNPTRRETFGKVTAEALSCGTPVVTYDTTACIELVTDECGYVEKVGDVLAVYEDIIKIVESKKSYTESCRKFAADNFDKEKCINKTIEFYNELLSD